MRRIYIVSAETKIDQAVIDAANAVSCGEIAQGIPAQLVGVVDPGELPTVYEEPDTPVSPHPSELFAEQTRVVADDSDTVTVNVFGDRGATVAVDVFFAWDPGEAVAADVELDSTGHGTLTIGPFEVGTEGQVVACSQNRTTAPYPRAVLEVVDA